MAKPRSAAFIAERVTGAILWLLLAITASDVANAAEIKVLAALGVKARAGRTHPEIRAVIRTHGHDGLRNCRRPRNSFPRPLPQP